MVIVNQKGVRTIAYVLDGYSNVEVEKITYTKVVYFDGHQFLYGKSDKYKFTTLWEAGTGVCTQNLGKNITIDEAVEHLRMKVEEAEDKKFPLALLVDSKRRANKLNLQLWEIALYLP